ncbi:hypothetical protein GOP47_0007329 [Adiantum capillus-veneris]|uniref:DNA polymerase n=1 Tax=Adiantum capillus-veneris TaxID=13818 RepID=A0A9D4V0H4_ADICA|nr:hypothetical protein GOP47_0007329 [Adiantum capillus-veneris]
MAPAERRRGPASSEASARASALAQLQSLRNQGGRRVDGFQLKLEDKIYDTLPEADYNLLVAKRRQSDKGFVVGDEGLGYEDVGEEEDWEVDMRPESSDEEEVPNGKAKKNKPKVLSEAKKETSKKAASLTAAAALLGRQRVSSMFAAASGMAALKRNSSGPGKANPSADNILDDVLADITVDDADRERERQRRRGGLGTRRTVSSSLTSPTEMQPQSSQSLAFTAQKPSSTSAEETTAINTLSNQDAPSKEMFPVSSKRFAQNMSSVEEAVAQDDDLSLPDTNGGCIPVHDSKEKVDPGMQSRDHEIAFVTKEESETKVGLNAKISQSSLDVKAPAPWHSLMEVKPEKVEAEETQEGSVAEGSDALQLDSDGKLNFFMIDAYEEAFGANPGTVFLFGKVRSGSKYMSCCVLVQNMQRCVYTVPSPSVFPLGLLKAYEHDCKSEEPGKQVEFMKKLQDLSKGLKAELAQRLMDMDVTTFRMAPVKRSYSFEDSNIPSGENYFLKLSYPFKDAPLPANMKGIHFSSVLGTNTSALELFLIKRKIKGPTWLSIEKPTYCSSSSQVSWCKMELAVDSAKQINVTPPGKAPEKFPPVIVASLNLKTVVNHKNNVNEIASASIVYCKKVKVDMPMPQAEWNTHEMLSHFSIVRKLDGGIFPVGFTTEVTQTNNKAGSNVLSLESSERALLNHLLIKLHQLDPDVLVGHNISGFDLDVLLHRLQASKVQSNIWSKIGRLKRSSMPKLTGGGTAFGAGASQGALACIAGRLLCDTYLASRDLLKEVSYTLTQLAKSQLGRDRRELQPADIPRMYESSTSLKEMVECGETDAWLALGLMFRLSVLPLARQLTNISGNLWNKTLQGARAQRVEYLLLHEFHARKYIVPDKLNAREKENLAHKRKANKEAINGEEDIGDDEEPKGLGRKGKKGPAYSGGLVLEPKKGLYDKFVLLLDFNSLYPSIIQEYNLCFTTVQRPADGVIPNIPSTDVPGVLPQILKSLVERRRQVKKWLKNTSGALKRQQLDIQQQALKLTANSMYGCLGFVNSRFYAKPLAELITSQGRDILQSTVDLVQNSLNLEVIYGDTDSIMIHTGLEDLQIVKSIAVKVIKEVNKKYKLLEIDLDGIFKRMLLLKKKKYASVKMEANGDGTFREVIEQKGLDIVRRDWSLISKDIGNFCLQQILSGGTCEDVVEIIHTELRKLQDEMRKGQVDLEKFVITKSLTKAPEAYPDAKNQPHVQVALRLKQAGHRIGSSVGDTVPYIICIEQGSGSTSGIAERARHPDELRQDPGNWMVDIDYYLSQQVHPVVSRLCAPIEGTDANRLAECLGLDSSKFQTRSSASLVQKDEALVSASAILDDDDRYRHCDPLTLSCPSCTDRYSFPGIVHIAERTKDVEDDESKSDSTLLPEDYLQCPKCRSTENFQGLSSAMLANQLKQRVDEFIGRYYEGWMKCDEELCGHTSRMINLRVLGDSERGTICPNHPRCSGSLIRQYTEVDLYKQLTHFCRLLDANRALEKIPEMGARLAAEKRLATLNRIVDSASHTVELIRDRCAYRWVQMEALCVSVS